jgi:single-stranded-DNA-specific exonuclease
MPQTVQEFAHLARSRFAEALAAASPDRPALIAGHFDADGLSSAALLARAFERAGRPVATRIIGRGESAWEGEASDELARADAGMLVVADLGARPDVIRDDVPVVVIDHHVATPGAAPETTTLISGYGVDPTPSTSLIAWWCAGALGDADDLLWLAAVGIIGDLGERAPFDELADAKKRYTASALKAAVALVNAPRRASGGDASPALAALMAADGPKAIVRGDVPGAAEMATARAEVAAEVAAARKLAPRFAGDVALIRMHSPCQIHPLIAQSWRGRLKDKIVIAANSGYRPGWVHFAVRSGKGENLIAFLAQHRPPGAGMQYGQGHEQATGGALQPDDWAAFLTSLGFAT